MYHQVLAERVAEMDVLGVAMEVDKHFVLELVLSQQHARNTIQYFSDWFLYHVNFGGDCYCCVYLRYRLVVLRQRYTTISVVVCFVK